MLDSRQVGLSLTLLNLILPLQGCGQSADVQEVEATSLDSPRKVPSWEEFKAQSSRLVEGRTIYIVEWDIPLQAENELRAYYDANFGPEAQKGIVATIGGADDVWSNFAELALTYCVSTNFGSDHSRAVSEMAVATQDWLRAANVRFVYDSSQNSNCTGSNPNVIFAVRAWTEDGACAFSPSGGGCVERTLVMNFSYNYSEDGNYPNLTTIGVFRHELGHILGLRHEHTRPESGVCFEDNNWRSLTPYDQNSVMHYPFCNGNASTDLTLTDHDKAAVVALYGIPAALYAAL